MRYELPTDNGHTLIFAASAVMSAATVTVYRFYTRPTRRNLTLLLYFIESAARLWHYMTIAARHGCRVYVVFE